MRKPKTIRSSNLSFEEYNYLISLIENDLISRTQELIEGSTFKNERYINEISHNDKIYLLQQLEAWRDLLPESEDII